MSNDLISRSAVLSVIDKVFEKYKINFDQSDGDFDEEISKAIGGITENGLIKLVNALPSAYDLESVIEQLEECKYIMETSTNKDCFGKECKVGDCTVCVFDKAIEIVKSGGVSVADGKRGLKLKKKIGQRSSRGNRSLGGIW